MPQIEVYLSELRTALLEAGEAGGCDLVTAIEVNTPQLGQPRPDVTQSEVSQPLTLANVEDVEVSQSLANLSHALVTDLAGDKGEAPEIEEAAGDVVHGAVGDPVTEREVKTLEADASLCQVTHTNVTDIVTTPEVQTPQTADL